MQQRSTHVGCASTRMQFLTRSFRGRLISMSVVTIAAVLSDIEVVDRGRRKTEH